MKKLVVSFLLVFSLLLVFSQPSSAQAFLRKAPPPPPSNPLDTQDVPLDGGLGLLLAAGMGYGFKRLGGRQRITSIK